MGDEPSIDPRFDPAFQRGFEGSVGGTRRRTPVGTPSVVPAQESVPKPDVVQPGRRPEIALPPRPEPVAPVTPAAEAEDDAPRRVNPFIVGLLVISVVLIGLGIWGSMFANTVFQTNLTSSVSYVTVLLVISSSAVSIGLGVATLIGIVFLYAARSLRR